MRFFLGRSLIYGTSLRNQFDFSNTTVFGGLGRANGEMNEPSGLFIDSGGNVISADSRNDRLQVRRFSSVRKTTPTRLMFSYISPMVNIKPQ